MDIYHGLIITHLIGAVLGVGGATFIEIILGKALADGKVDPVEGSFLKVTYKVTRIGLLISLFTGVSFVVFYILTRVCRNHSLVIYNCRNLG